jgi:hypothetical protein
MTVTRDVIYDLLPAYFAGEVSFDTRALIEEFFTTDPEFGRMAERFSELFDETRRTDADADSRSRIEVSGFNRARTRAEHRQIARGMGIGYALAALFALGMAFVKDPAHPAGRASLVIAAVFATVALACWISGAVVSRAGVLDLHPSGTQSRFRRKRWSA